MSGNWNNPDIDVKTRSIITVVALMSQGITDSSLKYHILKEKQRLLRASSTCSATTEAEIGKEFRNGFDADLFCKIMFFCLTMT